MKPKTVAGARQKWEVALYPDGISAANLTSGWGVLQADAWAHIPWARLGRIWPPPTGPFRAGHARIGAAGVYSNSHKALAETGLRQNSLKKTLHLSEIIATAAAVFALPASRLTWQVCSAAAHGRPWAKQFLTLFEAHDDDGISKTLSGQLISNQLAMAITLNNACEVFDKARTVRDKHSRNPSHTGSSFTNPSLGLHLVTKRLFTPSNVL